MAESYCRIRLYNGSMCWRTVAGVRANAVGELEPACTRHMDVVAPPIGYCAVCGRSLEGRRRHAVTCSTACRKALSRRAATARGLTPCTCLEAAVAPHTRAAHPEHVDRGTESDWPGLAEHVDRD